MSLAPHSFIMRKKRAMRVSLVEVSGWVMVGGPSFVARDDGLLLHVAGREGRLRRRRVGLGGRLRGHAARGSAGRTRVARRRRRALGRGRGTRVPRRRGGARLVRRGGWTRVARRGAG